MLENIRPILYLTHGSRLVLTSLALVLAGCVQLPHQNPPLQNEIERARTGADLYNGPFPDHLIADDQPFTLSESSKAYLLKQISLENSSKGKYRKLVLLLSGKKGLHLQYANDYTRTVDQTLLDRKGNCLSMTALFYALAKELQLDVSFNHVKMPPNWTGADKRTFVLYDHVNANVSLPNSQHKIVDFSARLFDISYPRSVISETQLKALYYSNRAVELMLEGLLEQSTRYILTALTYDDQNSSIWTNLGAIYKRHEAYELSEISFKQAILLDSHNYLAWSNLGYLYEKTGNHRQADGIRQAADRHRQRNPYYIHWQAEKAYAKGNYEESLNLVKKAIYKAPEEHRFHHTSALAYWKLDKPDLAEASLITAKQLAHREEQKNKYDQKRKWLLQLSRKDLVSFADTPMQTDSIGDNGWSTKINHSGN